MKIRHLVVASIAAFAVFAAPLTAQECEDISGAWDVTVTVPEGAAQEVVLVFEQDGCSATGTITGNNENSFEDGKVEGATFTFSASIETPNGPLTLNWTGTVDGDAISGTWGNDMIGSLDFAGTRADG